MTPARCTNSCTRLRAGQLYTDLFTGPEGSGVTPGVRPDPLAPSEFKTRNAGTFRDTPGPVSSGFGTVRAPGSSPGPPTIFVFEIGDFSGRAGVCGTQLDHNFLRRSETEAV